MEVLEIKVLKEIIENVPEDYEIYFTSGKNVFCLSDKFEIDVSQKKITFQKYLLSGVCRIISLLSLGV